jgi:hypothetical protein
MAIGKPRDDRDDQSGPLFIPANDADRSTDTAALGSTDTPDVEISDFVRDQVTALRPEYEVFRDLGLSFPGADQKFSISDFLAKRAVIEGGQVVTLDLSRMVISNPLALRGLPRLRELSFVDATDGNGIPLISDEDVAAVFTTLPSLKTLRLEVNQTIVYPEGIN